MSRIEEDDDDDKTTLKSISKDAIKTTTTTTTTTTKVIALWKKMEILYGSENIIKSTIEGFHLIKENLIIVLFNWYFSMFYNTPIWKEFIALRKR